MDISRILNEDQPGPYYETESSETESSPDTPLTENPPSSHFLNRTSLIVAEQGWTLILLHQDESTQSLSDNSVNTLGSWELITNPNNIHDQFSEKYDNNSPDIFSDYSTECGQSPQPTLETGKPKYTQENQEFLYFFYRYFGEGKLNPGGNFDGFSWPCIYWHYHKNFPGENRTIEGLNSQIYHSNDAAKRAGIPPQVWPTQEWKWTKVYASLTDMGPEIARERLVQMWHQSEEYNNPEWRARFHKQSRTTLWHQSEEYHDWRYRQRRARLETLLQTVEEICNLLKRDIRAGTRRV